MFLGFYDVLVEVVNNGLYNGNWVVVKEELLDIIVVIEWVV